mgnify:CR=1 FL=1
MIHPHPHPHPQPSAHERRRRHRAFDASNVSRTATAFAQHPHRASPLPAPRQRRLSLPIVRQVRRWGRALLLLVGVVLLLLATSARAVPGGLDNTFASGGTYQFSNAQGWIGFQSAVQSTGKIVTLHSCGTYSTSDLCVTRLQANGSGGIDTTFAAAAAIPGVFRTGDATAQEFGSTLLVDNSDRIIVAGRCGPTSPCIFRLTANGDLDTTFGTGGYARLPSLITAKGLALLGDGRIAVAGECFTSGHYVFCANRLTADGVQDSTFNSGSVRLIDMSASNNQASDIAVYPDGRMLITGYCDDSGSAKFCVTRLTLAGALDTSFNGTGIKLYSATGQTGDVSRRVRILPGGRIILAGQCGVYGNGSTWRFCVAALNDAGQPDAAFAGASFVWFNSVFTSVNLSLLHVADDGKVLLGGHCNNPPQIMCMLRTNPNGTFDTSFGLGGLSSAVPNTGGANVYGGFVAPGNKLLLSALCNVAGTDTTWITCVSRFDLGPPAGQHCSLDIDDDGFVKPQTDGLLWLRLMLGFRGNALTQNAVSSGAQRATAPAIFDHAYSQCGVR